MSAPREITPTHFRMSGAGEEEEAVAGRKRPRRAGGEGPPRRAVVPGADSFASSLLLDLERDEAEERAAAPTAFDLLMGRERKKKKREAPEEVEKEKENAARTPPAKMNKGKAPPAGAVLSQQYLDCGQKGLKVRTCDLCKMVYQPGLPADESSHSRHCDAFQNGVVLGCGAKDDGVVALEKRQLTHAAVRQALALMDDQLGDTGERSVPPGALLYAFVARGRAAGLLVARAASRADRALVRWSGGDAHPAEVGLIVLKIWVHKSHRGRGVATRLVDAARLRLASPLGQVRREAVAFTPPTTDGKAFASRYASGRYAVYGERAVA